MVDCAPPGLGFVRVHPPGALPRAIDYRAFSPSTGCTTGEKGYKRAESPAINSVGQRPTKKNTRKREAPEGRNQYSYTYYALSGLLTGRGDLFPGRCPVPVYSGLSAIFGFIEITLCPVDLSYFVYFASLNTLI
jgi:hypothetical protein